MLEAASAARPVLTDALFILTIAAASIVLALVSWVVIEQPFLRLKDRLAPRPA